MDIKKILKLIIDEKCKEERISIGKWENNVAVVLKNGTVLVLIPESAFLFDKSKFTHNGLNSISPKMIEDLLRVDANTIQVHPTPNTREYDKGVCRVFEGKDLTTHLNTKLLELVYDAKKDKDATFYAKNNKSPVIVKRGDMIIGAVCPVNIKQEGN